MLLAFSVAPPEGRLKSAAGIYLIFVAHPYPRNRQTEPRGLAELDQAATWCTFSARTAHQLAHHGKDAMLHSFDILVGCLFLLPTTPSGDLMFPNAPASSTAG